MCEGVVMDFFKGMDELIKRGTDQYIRDRVLKSIGKGDPCLTCGGDTVAYEWMDECPKCNRFTINRRGKR